MLVHLGCRCKQQHFHLKVPGFCVPPEIGLNNLRPTPVCSMTWELIGVTTGVVAHTMTPAKGRVRRLSKQPWCVTVIRPSQQRDACQARAATAFICALRHREQVGPFSRNKAVFLRKLWASIDLAQTGSTDHTLVKMPDLVMAGQLIEK